MKSILIIDSLKLQIYKRLTMDDGLMPNWKNTIILKFACKFSTFLQKFSTKNLFFYFDFLN